jgi:2,3-bisphosphoglycerate-independent phosphoglycerate mutase
VLKELSYNSATRIVLVVLDGVGGLPHPDTGKTELETADTPNLNRLAAEGVCGLSDPISPGITPGSAPGHLAIFGYDPVGYIIGRGVLEAIGIGFELEKKDIAARGNFCTVDEKGIITDRRAGRIATEDSAALCRMLDGVEINGVKIIVRPVKEHRFIAVFRGEGLLADVNETDPQRTGTEPETARALSPGAEKMSGVVQGFVRKAGEILRERYSANMVLLRGFSQHPELPRMQEIYKLTPAAIAVYPMYRGLASLAGMDILETGSTLEDEFATLESNYDKYDFFFMHIKWTDSSGEDGDFERKVGVLEQIDGCIPRLLNLKPDVIVVTGDHSTPALLASHSWHPVPVLLHSKWCRADNVKRFGEFFCLNGGLGRIAATDIMPLAMANALKLDKFGA